MLRAGDAYSAEEARSSLPKQFAEQSDLARVLEALYQGLASKEQGASLTVNRWMTLNLTLSLSGSPQAGAGA